MTLSNAGKVMLRTLDGEKTPSPPIWLMRQAGRYLPEYRAVRAKARNFIEFCYTPDMATEVTLQPIRRFGFDAAIMFSDILVVPDALGQNVRFVEGEGPRLEPLRRAEDIAALKPELDLDRLSPVFTMIGQVRVALPAETTFLGFCGAPWTVASYMIAGRGTPDLAPSRLFAYAQPELFATLMDRLVDASICYLIAQLRAGVDAVQIFESFAGAIPPAMLDAWSIDPIRRVINGVRAEIPEARIIVFAKGAGASLDRIALGTGATAVGIDWSTHVARVDSLIPAGMACQGNLDPLALVAGGAALRDGVERILSAWAHRPFVFNLGHGITPETPIAHVESMVAQVRGA